VVLHADGFVQGRGRRTDRCEGLHRTVEPLIAGGRVDPTPLTTHTFDFGDIERAFRMMQTKEDGIIKPLIRFW
jgi:threonine dehydrogenase-like Zn-dependent dehydrogenase